MTLLQEAPLKKTPLYDRHLSLGAKIVDFGGWAMPVYYSSIIAEHQWVRKSSGIFDVSHLGEFRVKGKGAFRFLQYRLANDLNRLVPGHILYSLLLNEEGRTLDDILVYCENHEDYYLVVNAANIEKDFEALSRYAPDTAELTNHSDDTACIAIQGPTSQAALEKIFGWRLGGLAYYAFTEVSNEGKPCWVSRTGYTGEDGFEIFSRCGDAPALWDRLVQARDAAGLMPVGLGARNTLRLEAGNVLYGHELDETTTPLEAGMGWSVAMNKEGGFVGRDMLLVGREKGVARRLAGFKMLDKFVPREDYGVFRGEKRIGKVTSGSFAPTVGTGIGFAYVSAGNEAEGTSIEIEIHGRKAPAVVMRPPFVPLRHKGKVSS